MKQTDEEVQLSVQRYMERDRRAGKVVELGFEQQRLLAFAFGALVFGAFSVASGRGMSVYTQGTLLCSVGWYVQASRFAKHRATLYNAGTLAWRRQNVFIYLWCNTYLPLLVGLAIQVWWMQSTVAGLVAMVMS